MAVTQAQFDADQQVEAADTKTLITALGTFVTAYQSLAANPAVADLTSEDTQAKADDASIKSAIASVQAILTPPPATKDAAPATKDDGAAPTGNAGTPTGNTGA